MREAFPEDGGEEPVSAGGDEPLGRIDDLPQPAITPADDADARSIPERGGRGAVVRRGLVPPVGFLPELASGGAAGGPVRAPLALGGRRRHGRTRGWGGSLYRRGRPASASASGGGGEEVTRRGAEERERGKRGGGGGGGRKLGFLIFRAARARRYYNIEKEIEMGGAAHVGLFAYFVRARVARVGDTATNGGMVVVVGGLVG